MILKKANSRVVTRPWYRCADLARKIKLRAIPGSCNDPATGESIARRAQVCVLNKKIFHIQKKRMCDTCCRSWRRYIAPDSRVCAHEPGARALGVELLVLHRVRLDPDLSRRAARHGTGNTVRSTHHGKAGRSAGCSIGCESPITKQR